MDVFVRVTVNGPHNWVAAEPECESNQSGVEELAATRTEVENVGCDVAVIVAELQGSGTIIVITASSTSACPVEYSLLIFPPPTTTNLISLTTSSTP